jgi:hypothetical protein
MKTQMIVSGEIVICDKVMKTSSLIEQFAALGRFWANKN